jgi:hypothetical protein
VPVKLQKPMSEFDLTVTTPRGASVRTPSRAGPESRSASRASKRSLVSDSVLQAMPEARPNDDDLDPVSALLASHGTFEVEHTSAEVDDPVRAMLASSRGTFDTDTSEHPAVVGGVPDDPVAAMLAAHNGADLSAVDTQSETAESVDTLQALFAAHLQTDEPLEEISLAPAPSLAEKPVTPATSVAMAHLDLSGLLRPESSGTQSPRLAPKTPRGGVAVVNTEDLAELEEVPIDRPMTNHSRLSQQSMNGGVRLPSLGSHSSISDAFHRDGQQQPRVASSLSSSSSGSSSRRAVHTPKSRASQQ